MIKRLYIHNYKCFSNFQFRPENPNPLLIIGRNGVGKSSLGKVLKILRDYAEGRTLSDYFTDEDLSKFAYEAPIEIEADVEVAAEVVKIRLQIQADKTSQIGYKILEEVAEERAKEILKTIEVIRPSPEVMTSLIGIASEGNHLLSDCSNFATWFATHEALNHGVREEFVKSLANAFEDFISYSYARKDDGYHLSCHFKADEKPEVVLDFNQLSDGEKCRFVASAIAVINKLGSGLICFWDEPDNFVTTSEEASLFYALSNAFLQKGQLIVATHSELGILTFNDVETYVFDRRSHASPILPPANLSELRRQGALIGSLQSALVSGGISL